MPDDLTPSFRVRAIALMILVVALIALASSDTAHGTVLGVLEASRHVIQRHSVAGPALFVALAALSAMLAFFSSAVLIPAAVFAWGGVTSAMLLWLGWMLGGITSYSLARLVGRPLFRWIAPGWRFAPHDGRITQGTRFGVVLLFQLALPSEIPGYVLGLVRYPPGRYLAALAIAELPYAVGTTLLGASFIERRFGMMLSLGAAAALAALLLSRALRRRWT